jgi:predicted permease
MHALVACQSAFCFLVLFAAGLFAGTFTRLAELPMGFSAERLLAVETVTPGSQPAAYWEQAASRLRSIAGVESTGISAWPLMTGEQRNNRVSVNGAPPSDALAFFLAVSPGWAGTMKIPLLAGRDFLPTDVYPEAAIVNAEFARRFFDGANPVGKVFESPEAKGAHFQIVGLAGNARYRSMREEMLPVIYVPFASAPVSRATFMVRTASSNPMALAAAVRAEVARGGVGFRASNIRTQVEIDDAQTVRERLLALLGAFFAGVALLLAGIGMYGVLDYSVQQRGREIGIRRAIGAKGGDIAWRVTSDVLAMMAAGALAGLGIGVFSVRYIEPLFFGVKGSDAGALALPTLMICVAALVAAAPAVVRAVRIDTVKMLRSE